MIDVGNEAIKIAMKYDGDLLEFVPSTNKEWCGCEDCVFEVTGGCIINEATRLRSICTGARGHWERIV